jgi:hypothetical protein
MDLWNFQMFSIKVKFLILSLIGENDLQSWRQQKCNPYSSLPYSSQLGQVNLISRLSSSITKKYGADERILFYNFHFPKEKLLMNKFVFINKMSVI